MHSLIDLKIPTLAMAHPLSSLASPVSPSMSKKRRFSSSEPLTPPLSATEPEGSRLILNAVHVASTAATALAHVTLMYQSDPVAADGLLRAVECVTSAVETGGKLIICGVGKSGRVAEKTVATMKSLGVTCSFLHAAEAMHGDLGDVRRNDAVMFVSYSGKTAELLAVLDHVPQHVPVIALTSHTKSSDCPLLRSRPDGILLPAPIHEKEEVSFGVCAPTTSTTVAMVVGDMLALTTARVLHRDVKEVFRRNHPGGAIGQKSERKELDAVVEEVEVEDRCAKRQRGPVSPPDETP